MGVPKGHTKIRTREIQARLIKVIKFFLQTSKFQCLYTTQLIEQFERGVLQNLNNCLSKVFSHQQLCLKRRDVFNTALVTHCAIFLIFVKIASPCQLKLKKTLQLKYKLWMLMQRVVNEEDEESKSARLQTKLSKETEAVGQDWCPCMR